MSFQFESNLFYFGYNLRAISTPGEEMFGISIGKLYFGIYSPGYFRWYENIAFGFLNANNGLD